MTIEHIESRVADAKQQGIIYESLHELLLDEEMEERGMPHAEREIRRKNRLAVIGAQEEVGSQVVSDLAEKDFDIIAFVEKVDEALEVLKKVNEALKHYKGTGLKIVADKLDDEDRATALFSRVSQVISIWEARKAYFEVRSAQDYYETALRPSLVIANACKRSGVDRIIFASHGSTLKEEKMSKNALAVLSRPGGTSLSEEAIRQSGVPYVVARFPKLKKKTDATELDAAVGTISHIVMKKDVLKKDLEFSSDRIETAMLKKIGTSKSPAANALSRKFLLCAVARATGTKGKK